MISQLNISSSKETNHSPYKVSKFISFQYFFIKIEKEVIECMTRALKYLEVELHYSSSDRSSLAKYRAGTIHHRLASLLHNAFRTEVR